MRRATDNPRTLGAARLAMLAALAAGTVTAAPAAADQFSDSVLPLPIPTFSPRSPVAELPVIRPELVPNGSRLGLHVTGDANLTFVGQNASGPGQFGSEAPGFMTGSPLAPNTPYDLFTSAPEVSGNAGIGQIVSTAGWGTNAFDFGLSAGLASVRGSVTNAAYWGENLIPTINPHVGSQALPYSVTFPTHPGQDDGNAARLSLLSGSAATADGNLRLRGGWIDLAQTDRFVFAQPPLTSVNPAIGYGPAETLSSGFATLDSWQPVATALPLHGIDVTAKHGLATFEATNAALPSLPGESARLSLASVVIDHGGGTRLSAQVLHATTSGTQFVSTVPFGKDPTFTLTPQGVLPASYLDGQRQTIAGLRGAVHLMPALGLDGVVEVGRSWYASTLEARPGTAAPGGFYRAGFDETRGRVTAALDLYRMESRYAPMILPYGIGENQWSVAFAWPGQWLKSNYQLVDNSALGVNRQGFRLRYLVDRGPFELHAEYTELHQIDPETFSTSQQTGFVDGYYLPQRDDAATLGTQKRSGLWLAWHPAFGDVTLDLVDDTLYRPFLAAHPEDAVSYEVPQATLSIARHLTHAIVVSAGAARFALKGTFSEPLDFSERMYFAGVEAAQTPHSTMLVSVRRTTAGGTSTFPLDGRSPNFTATTFIVEQRLHL